MKRQRLRKLILIAALLLFPVTLYYFSPALIINAALNGIINGSFIVFVLMFILSIPFGRLFCAYLCPAGGLQECAFLINEKQPKQGWRNYIKYIIWIIWISIIIFCYFHKGKIVAINFLFETENGISVSSIQSYIIYYGIVCLIFIPSVLFGKRVFCHYFCWMAPFMVLGTKLRKLWILTWGIFRDLITVIFCYKNLAKPLKTLKFSWVSSPSHLVSCYIVLPLFTNPHKGKNKGKKIW